VTDNIGQAIPCLSSSNDKGGHTFFECRVASTIRSADDTELTIRHMAFCKQLGAYPCTQ